MTLKETLAALALRAPWTSTAEHEFHTTLETLYRTGQLVVAPSVEDVAPSLTRAFCENVDDWMESRIDDADMGAILAAAILTSMGAKTDG